MTAVLFGRLQDPVQRDEPGVKIVALSIDQAQEVVRPF